MKYVMEKINSAEKPFRPFKITLEFETREEYVNFHDNVMPSLTKVYSHIFHQQVWQMGRSEIDGASGNIYLAT